MIIEKDVPIEMSDGSVLYANVFRPEAAGTWPVVMAFGVYGKDVHFADGWPAQWKRLNEIYPGLCQDGSTGKHLVWEAADPERWVPDGFVIVIVDGRGSGRSPGYLDVFSPRETRDYHECIEWAGTTTWSNGKVGLLGVSYLAIKQWQVAALRPPHLAAIVPWEGASNYYRDSIRHGGILSNGFRATWWPKQVLSSQNGNAETTHRDRETGLHTNGNSLSADMLAGSRSDCPRDMLEHPLYDAWAQDRAPRLERIEVPVLSAANWGGPANHLRGNVEGYLGAGSKEKWLFAHIGTHYESFYLPHYVAIQKRFLNHYLRGEENGWEFEPRVQLEVRRPDGTATTRHEHEWPLARTEWTRFYLDAASATMGTEPSDAEGSATYEAMKDSISFSTAPFESDTEFTGPASLRLWVSSSTSDLDVFAVLRVFDPDGQEVTFIGAHEPVPMALGWLRASHRKTSAELSHPYRPWHTHDEVWKLTPGEAVALDVEIWPTSMVFPKGWRLVLTLQGHDFIVVPPGRMRHDHPLDRPADEFGGANTVFTGGDKASYLLMPLVPARTD
ncbi:CocE/NonD family hydrolase [Hydrogenophaga sp. BPS33]|uniref:CocE/NonD family hydrolase n=1 Tax=Hydrogenophaga sp. BPS33 TaxID=2651974 RepID=UPI00131F8421|nr:CocE/NonD family hydrolase [Hydrogenophaga sp. BPS33]QHE86871.1 CocE/NonD family hydrolase [Hydrogenophaga sp. BPS33]